MADIRIKDLPLATGGTAPVGTDAVAIDGLTTRRTTIADIGDIAVPVASQAEAEAGVNAVKRMTPLTVKQSISANGATAAQGSLADSSLQPSDIGIAVQAQATQLDDLSNNLLKFTKVGGVDYGVDIARTITGASAVGINANLVNITADNADVTGPNFVNGMTFQHQWGGGQGGRQGTYSLSVQTSPSDPENANRNYVSGASTIVTGGDGGVSLADVNFSATLTNSSDTALVANTAGLIVGMSISGDGVQPGSIIDSIIVNTSVKLSKPATNSGLKSLRGRGSRGAYFAHAFVGHLTSSATNVFEVSGGEVNIIMEAGSSAKHKVGFSIVGHEADAVEGADTNAMLLFGNQGPSILWRDGILFSDINGYFPIKSSGSLFRSVAGTVLNAIDLSSVTATDSLLKGPSVRVKDTSGFSIFGGTGVVVIQPNGANLMSFSGVSGGDTQLVLNGQGAGAPPFITTSGPATDIDFIVRTKGAGTLDINFPTTTTVGAAGAASAVPATPTEYITVKVNGASRKIAVYNT